MAEETTNEIKEVPFSRLEERIGAYTEMQGKYYQSLSKILEILEQNQAKIIDLKQEFHLDARDISNNISTILNTLSNSNDNIKTLLKDIAHGINDQNKSINEIVLKFELEKQTIDSLLTFVNELVNNFSSFDMANTNKMDDLKINIKAIRDELANYTAVPGQVDLLCKEVVDRKSFIKRSAWVLAIVGTIIAGVLALIQANLINITWFPK
jgi:hypothetical protein